MFLFLVFGRMTEIRPDTFRLLLFNAAWFALLMRRLNVAALLCGLSLLFSARAAVMAIPMSFLLLWLGRKNPFPLLAIGAALAVVGVTAYLANPTWMTLVVKSVYFSSLSVVPKVPMIERFFELERTILVVMIAAALLGALKHPGDDRSTVIAVACASQLFLIVVDPGPFGYVYGWAMIPTLYGLLRFEKILPFVAGSMAFGLCALSLTYPIWRGHPVPTGNVADLTLDRPQSYSNDTTPDLVRKLIKPHELWDQLSIRTELCRRIRRPVAVYFWYQPICLNDALPDWIGLTWTSKAVADAKPALVVWRNGNFRLSAP